jgi:hypothetical protein
MTTTTQKRSMKDLASLSNSELEKILVAGKAPPFSSLDGHQFRGWNTPLMAHVLRIKKFAKGFLSKKDGRNMGYNCPVRQNGFEGAWELKPSNEQPKRFGYYEVRKTSAGDAEHRYPEAWCLDYGRGENPWWEPAKFLRDYLVQVDADNPDLLLGKAYVALGPARIFGGYFILERLKKA